MTRSNFDKRITWVVEIPAKALECIVTVIKHAFRKQDD
jgi:hypothetical protein